MRTWNAKPGEVDRKWWLIDAEGQTVGRLATRIAGIVRGKNKPTFTPHVDTGDFVVVVNADKVKLTGAKWDDKVYYRRSRYIGSLKETTAQEMLDKNPTFIIQEAVRGMLPKNRLGRKLIGKVKAYSGATHPHEAQKLEKLSL